MGLLAPGLPLRLWGGSLEAGFRFLGLLEVLGFSEALLQLLWCVPWGSLGGSGLSEALLGLWRWVSQGSLGGCGLSEALWR